MQSNSRRLNIFYKKRGKISIARPLLALNRLQVLKICIFWRLPLYIDSTNKLTNFRRNRLRHQIFPLLKIFFNPKIDIALTRFISIINYENDYFKNHLKNIEKFFKIKKLNSTNVKKIQNPKWLVFLPNALQRKFYKQLLVCHFKSLTFSEIEFLLKLNASLFK
jgi:tRNA(Ile)-lysidine synthase TilS/MesJ